MTRPNDVQPVESRPLSGAERRLVDRLLEESFPGDDAVRAQLADASIIEEGTGDTRTFVFACPSPDVPRADNSTRVPVDAVMVDEDGAHIEILLHIVDGYAREIEVYRSDGAPIQRKSLDGPLVLVNWKPAG